MLANIVLMTVIKPDFNETADSRRRSSVGSPMTSDWDGSDSSRRKRVPTDETLDDDRLQVRDASLENGDRGDSW